MSTIAIPLFADRHNHPLLYAAFRQGIDLSHCRTTSEALTAVFAKASSSEGTQPVIGYGWLSQLGRFSEAELQCDSPLVIIHRSLHELQLNQNAKRWLRKRYGEESEKLHNREWFERNFVRVLNWFVTGQMTAGALVEFYDWLSSLGIGYAEEMLLCDSNEIELFREAGLSERTRFWSDPRMYFSMGEDHRQQVAGFKLFADGAIGAFTAAMHEPFLGQESSQSGILNYEDHELAQQIYELAPEGKGLAIHAIGDKAIDQVVRILSQLGTRIQRFTEIRIEHAQLISRGSATIAKRLGVTLCMQPNFNSDTLVYEVRLGSDRAARNNPFRMLIDGIGFEPGLDLIFGTDGMPQGATACIEQGINPPVPGQQLKIEELKAGFGGVPVRAGHIRCSWNEENGYSITIDENMAV